MSETGFFTEEFFPKNLSEFVGNPEVVREIQLWVAEWNANQKQKPILLVGPTGVGKTCLAYVLAKEADWELFELNASDFRNKEQIERVAGGAALNSSFSGKKRLVLLDEVDGIHGKEDKGGIQAVVKLLGESNNPMILTANDIYSDKSMAAIRGNCKVLQFKKINYLSVAKRLKQICDLKKIDYDVECVTELAKNSEGDMRAALMDLQFLSQNNQIFLDDVQSSGFRERQDNIFNVIRLLLKGKTLQDIRRARFSSELDHDMLKQWIEENIPRHFTTEQDIAAAFELLSTADVFDGRIMKRQHYGFLKISSELMTSVALRTTEPVHGFIPYQFPSLLKKMSSSSSARALRKQLAKKIGEKTHSSIQGVISEDLDYMKQMFQNKDLAIAFTKTFELDEDEIAYLLDTTPNTKKVKTIFDSAQQAAVAPVFRQKEAEESSDSDSDIGEDDFSAKGKKSKKSASASPVSEDNQTSLSKFFG